jgi:hypothetical protein
MANILIHSRAFEDIKFYRKKKWYNGLGEQMPRICRLLIQDNKMPGESPVHHVKLPILQGKTFHAGIALPKEKVGKKKGARFIYVRESFDSIKIIYVGGHKDRRYDDSNLQIKLIEERYLTENYIAYTEGLNFDGL